MHSGCDLPALRIDALETNIREVNDSPITAIRENRRLCCWIKQVVKGVCRGLSAIRDTNQSLDWPLAPP
jgi:hypothetical protein